MPLHRCLLLLLICLLPLHSLALAAPRLQSSAAVHATQCQAAAEIPDPADHDAARAQDQADCTQCACHPPLQVMPQHASPGATAMPATGPLQLTSAECRLPFRPPIAG
ncbi:hypothetical protein N8I74_16975 [Chitiniphilus purpureus]|uniref:DUF2946 domain-containing protein n=1 Tax=Chitiniphilus purpureus TaxID=2981137 RepID=A0ABY6DKV2_9NEIS|nr:hypothetical protein [Chitiniphilus sp. CD1]UXY14990.1 hypothetical protein N8I74_16975 [Chitiniphilus sp. CD1]